MVHAKTGKPLLVTGSGGPEGCEMSKLTHFVDNRLTDGGEAVSLTRLPLFVPQEYSYKVRPEVFIIQIIPQSFCHIVALYSIQGSGFVSQRYLIFLRSSGSGMGSTQSREHK
jgi:hypothetical protein